MIIEFIKPFTIGPRLLEPGYVVDTKTMPFMAESMAENLVKQGVAQAKKEPKETKEKPKNDT